MNEKFVSEYFTLSSEKNVDKANGIAMFCAIVTIFACSFSITLKSSANRQPRFSGTVNRTELTKSDSSSAAKSPVAFPF